ncbi:AAA+ family ATPase [Picosynechococcus sp. PCC 7003]|uniref:ATP-binding protein n=1 Tax=Picosynechococcus sp. PCC 7003 TaxID=374981 RepID=UPI00081046BE|nr:ATP-binding protein [Picosynechococcus sp. PCC 7003]ANV84066.1 AAA+ family ATPase [Picosynechococcus sp. PCC 7003]
MVAPASNTISTRLLYPQIASLLIFQGVFADPVGQTFLALLESLYSDQAAQSSGSTASIQCLRRYGRWFQALAIADVSWQDWLVGRILQDDNPFSRQAQVKSLGEMSHALQEAVRHDLTILHQVYLCEPETVRYWVTVATQVATTLTPWRRSPVMDNAFLHSHDAWPDSLEQLAGYYHRHGAGQFSQYGAFRWAEASLQPVVDPEWLPLDDIVGYPEPKTALIRNTEALLQGLPALNVLLYGSRGSGKSSLVKALLGAYYDQGLRLIEVDKTGLGDLPQIVEILRQQPQKFIIFVDDLSFEEDDEVFKSLKVVLEGSIRAKASNVVVYATSNRRHLVREFFEERSRPSQAEEIHHWDTVQEKLSFSDRFGLTLTFAPANQATYLEIVHHLAQKAGLNLTPADLDFQAKQWATRHNGRSGRTARQFIDFLVAEQALNFPQ